MRFRERQVDGFFVIHTCNSGILLSELIQKYLESYNADMEDVQYSTHLTQHGEIMNDVLVMYRTRRGGQNAE